MSHFKVADRIASNVPVSCFDDDAYFQRLREEIHEALDKAVASERQAIIAWFEAPERRMTFTANEVRECIRARKVPR